MTSEGIDPSGCEECGHTTEHTVYGCPGCHCSRLVEVVDPVTRTAEIEEKALSIDERNFPLALVKADLLFLLARVAELEAVVVTVRRDTLNEVVSVIEIIERIRELP